MLSVSYAVTCTHSVTSVFISTFSVNCYTQGDNLGVHESTKPLLFREFLELLVRLAKAKYVDAEPSQADAAAVVVTPDIEEK